MGIAHRHALDSGVGVGVEHVALRVGVQQRLRVVLAVQVDEQAADFAEHADRHGRAVYPGARLPLAQHFALEDESSLL